MLIDFDALRERAADDEELLCELLDDFLANVAGMMSEIGGEKPAVETQRAAHRLRGALLALCAAEAADAAFEVESGPTPEHFASLRAVLDETVAEMRAYVTAR